MYPNYIKKLIGMEGVKIREVEIMDGTVKIHIETKGTEQQCPRCGEKTSKVSKALDYIQNPDKTDEKMLL